MKPPVFNHKQYTDLEADYMILKAENEKLKAQLSTTNKRLEAAVEDLKISAYCRTCAKECGLCEALSKRDHDGGCKDYEWRGPVDGK